MSEPVQRRVVLRRLGQAGLVLGGSSLLGGLGLIAPGRRGAPGQPLAIPDHTVAADPRFPPLAVARGGPPARLVQAAVEAVGGMARFVRPGDNVLLKPNMAWDRTVEQGANTHPEVVAETIRLCREAKAGRIVVAEVPVHDAARVGERSGVRRAALEAGAEFLVPPREGFRPAALGGAALAQWEVFAPLLSADKVINLPVVKDHSLTRLTCGLKNWYGLLGGTRARLHQEIHLSIVDLAAAMRPTLTVVDATRVMMRGGPTGGRLDDVARIDAVAAGTDPVALDAWGATLLGVDPRQVRHLEIAEGRGLGSLSAGAGSLGEIHAGSS